MYDAKNMQKLERVKELSPAAFKAFAAFDAAAVENGALTVKIKELIAVGVAVTTQCPYCIEKHARLARAAGATDQELAEAAIVAAAIRAGGAMTHITHALA
ncbi:MAG: carboxymuconolactone decarboxylase family protein [Phycisphaerales bacterium]|nr:carboxymuconolactone decarboxylase family protein [Phycisphaerales bacterium]